MIPVHGGWETTARCLRHLAAQTVPHTVIVVDNASPDETAARVRSDFPQVRLLEMGENAGFSRAVNRGIAAGDGEIVVMLNNDVDCDPDMLERVAEAFADRAVGSATPLLLRGDGPRDRIDGFGIAVDATLAGYVRLQGHPLAALRDAELPPLIGPYGAAAAYRRTALAEVGGLDERIFMYGEELDLALRLRAAAWLAVAVPAARGVHHGAATAGKRSAWQRRRGGFARGYLLRRYGILRSRVALRVLATELLVVVGDAAIARDAEALRGRLEGWHAARGCPRHRVPADVAAARIGFLASLRLRVADYRPRRRG